MRVHAVTIGSALALALWGSGCSCGGTSGRPLRDGGGMDSMDTGGPGAIDAGPRRDGGLTGPVDAYTPPNPDAFFYDDPPPMTCYPDGGMGPWPDPPGGTPDCPDDRAREGCRCDDIGATAACWPGPRRNRMRGICRDGTATCLPYDEFGGRWGPCVGAVLPTPGVERGPAACECFSMGRWQIDNLSPCFVTYGGGTVYAVSTFIDASGRSSCPRMISSTPPPSPEPGQPWSTHRLTVDCAGQFRLCYRLRAGNVASPAPSDCVLTEVCVETWYPTANIEQELPPLPAWSSPDTACARRFRDSGGYGEMVVIGRSIECDDISDGGSPYVFHRVGYCPLRCNDMPSLPECMGCMMGGSGVF